MKPLLRFVAVVALACAFVAVPLRTSFSEAGGYSFKVHNTTKDKITKLLASEDGETYGSFDVGSKGIAPDETITLNWDKSTNKSSCKWYIKAVFEDGSETDAKQFDFCEEDLELEF